MAKRKATKKVPKRTKVSPLDRLRKALAKRTKAELVDVIVEFASEERKILRELEAQFNVEAPSEDLVASTRQAIADATDFDEREINYNFDYDYQAYSTVQKNLKRLVSQGCFQEAMKLSIELMSQGSYQVEMSDEGMMTDDIEDCLRPVIQGLKKSDISAKNVLPWCKKMEAKDRIGCICDQELESLRKSLTR
jgi:hypothetical protein